jgi:hypothetical protein
MYSYHELYSLNSHFSGIKKSSYPTCPENNDTDNHCDGNSTGSLAKLYDPRFLYYTSPDKATFVIISNTKRCYRLQENCFTIT